MEDEKAKVEDMTTDEVSAEIAEFMGSDYEDILDERHGYYYGGVEPRVKPYCESLDLLVPVWEKMGQDANSFLFHKYKTGWQCRIYYTHNYVTARTIQEAAVRATLKAIRELGGAY